LVARVRPHFRAYPRRPSDLAVALRVAGEEQKARLVDIGLGGAGVAVDRPLEVGATLSLVLHAPNRWDPLHLQVRVAWAAAGRAGLAFAEQDDGETYALYELLVAQVFDH
jgi:hypothetical protein